MRAGKRVLINNRFVAAGGVESHLLNLCRMLVSRGAEVTVVSRVATSAAPLVRLHREIPVRFLTTPFAGNARWLRLSTAWAMALWPLSLRREFDVLFSFEISPFSVWLSRRFLSASGVFIAGRAGSVTPPGDKLNPAAERTMRGLVVETEFHAQRARDIYRSAAPIASIPLLGTVEAAPPRTRRPEGILRVAYIGRYTRGKGIFNLVELWPSLRTPDIALDFYGAGPCRRELEAAIRAAGLQDRLNVHDAFAGSEALSAIMAQTDLLVLPSESEGLPVVLLEALAYGVPFVATDVGAVHTLAVDNPDVRVVPNTVAAVRGAIDEMAGDIRSSRVRGDRLQEYHAQRYSYEAVAGRWWSALLEPDQFWPARSNSSGP
jgi:glycosyltransferase involved in cell wall biosynthesis